MLGRMRLCASPFLSTWSLQLHCLRRAELGDVSAAVGKLAADGARTLKEQKLAPDSAVARRQIGAAPSLADCVGGLQGLR